MNATSSPPAPRIPSPSCAASWAPARGAFKHVLTADHARRIALLVNDLSAANIDAEVITNEFEEVLAQVNGCTRCSLDEGVLPPALLLIQRGPPPERILIGTSDVADPVHAKLVPRKRLDAAPASTAAVGSGTTARPIGREPERGPELEG